MDHDPNNSKPGPAADPNFVWEFVKELGQQERHFDEAINRYKGMASSWLLASFAAMGFILANNIEPSLLYIAGVGLAGAIGIISLWIIDIKVYQQLLNAAFNEARLLEDQNVWLPRTRSNMTRSQATGSVVANISWFYILGVSIPALIFDFSLGTYLLIHFGKLCFVIFSLLAGFVVFFLAYNIRFVKRLSTTPPDPNLAATKKITDLKEKTRLLVGGGVFYVLACVALYLTQHYPQNPEPASLHSAQALHAGVQRQLLYGSANEEVEYLTLPPGTLSETLQYSTGKVVGYVISGSGLLWQKSDPGETNTVLLPGTNAVVQPATRFRFKNTGSDSLKILLIRMMAE